ncbi:MAG TPA: cation diffusion facilitator family transporter [Gammaproteobacteria bacterium]|nr:cation diffusion facilitator family transporter [Gammaproteobacteria bacterium]
MENQKNTDSLVRSASIASLLVASTLIVLKYYGWVTTTSVSLLGSLADSLIDFLASVFVFVAISYSMLPADAKHRFGYGKSEGLAAFVQSLFIGISGIYVCFEAIKRLLNPSQINQPSIAIWIILVSIVLTLALVMYQKYVVKKSKSIAIESDRYHYLTDTYINLSVLFSIAITGWTRFVFIDALVGLLISGVVLYTSVTLLKKSFKILLDQEIQSDDRDRIREIALDHPKVLGFHDLRTRDTGRKYIIQFHLELDPNMSLLESHEITDEVTDNVLKLYPDSELIIHTDPLGIDEERDPFE